MGDEQSTTQQTTYSQRSGPSTSRHQAAYAIERAKILFGCYRRGDANDPDAYVAAVAAVLSRYDPDLIREVTDPNTGIQTTEKFETFLPNSGELKRYCEAADARKTRLQELGKLPRVDFNREQLAPPRPAPCDQATIFVPATNARYPALLEWSKMADPRLFKFEARPGIWVGYGVWENRRTVTRERVEDPRPMMLSETARKMMADIDAERNRDLPADQSREVVG